MDLICFLIKDTKGLFCGSGYDRDSPVISFFDYHCITEGSSSSSPTIPGNWCSSSEASPMVSSGLSSFGSCRDNSLITLKLC